MAALGIIGAITSAVGTIANASAMSAQAGAEQTAANYKADMENRQAMEQRAAAQRSALDQRKKTALVQSRLQADAAASGGGATDPTILKLGSDIAGQGEYNALSEIYSGESRATGLENQGALDRYSGAARASSLQSRSFSTILGGLGGLAGDIYKMNRPPMLVYG